MIRRQFLSTTGLTAAAALLAGCSLGSQPMTPADVISRAINVGRALDAMLGQFHTQYPSLLSDDLFARIETYVTQAETAATALVNGMPAPAAAPVVNQIVGYVEDALGVLTSPPLGTMIPPPYQTVIQAVAFTLPLLVAFAQVYVPNANQPVVAARYGIKPMSASAADAVVATWAQRR